MKCTDYNSIKYHLQISQMKMGLCQNIFNLNVQYTYIYEKQFNFCTLFTVLSKKVPQILHMHVTYFLNNYAIYLFA